MKIEKIKPIPNYIVERIRRLDKRTYCGIPGTTRFYSYLTTNDNELAKITVAVKCYRKEWFCKQVAVHGLHSDKCFIKDIVFFQMGNYSVGWFAEGLQKYQKWYEDSEWGWQYDKNFDPYAPLVNKDYLAQFPEFKYSAYMLYEGVQILQYLRLYEKYPQIEYLMKLGLSAYAFSVTILKRIGKDKAFVKWLIRNKDELNKPYYGYYIETVIEAYKTNRPFKEVQDFLHRKKCFIRNSNRNYAEIRKIFPGRKLKIFFDYIDRQNIKPELYSDYLNACNYLGLDMSLPKNSIPHDFKHWHDIRIDQYAIAKAKNDESTRPEFYAKFLSIANKYLTLQLESQNNFICIIAKSPSELIREGKYLNHCVGRMNYEQKVVREESLIFFVRKTDQPNIPYVTVEYSLEKHTVLQCYGFDNLMTDNDARDYVYHIWLPYANKHLKQIAA